MLFVYHPTILHNHRLQFLLGQFNSQEKLKQCLYKILEWQTKSIVVCYDIFWSDQFGESLLDWTSLYNFPRDGQNRARYTDRGKYVSKEQNILNCKEY